MDLRNDERITAYIDGEMNDLEAARFERELEKNPDLDKMVGELRRMRDVMRRLAAEEAPRGLFNRVMDRVDVDAARSKRRPWYAGFGTMPIMSMALAASALFFTYALSTNLMAPETAMAPNARPEEAQPAIRLEHDAPKAPPLGSNGPVYMAPDAYRFKGAGSLAALQAAASTVDAKVVDRNGVPTAGPDEKNEVWLDIDASQVSRFRLAMEGKTIIEPIGMGRVIEGRIRLRVIVQEAL